MNTVYIYGHPVHSPIQLPGFSRLTGTVNTQPGTLHIEPFPLPPEGHRNYNPFSSNIFQAGGYTYTTIATMGAVRLTANTVTIDPEPKLPPEHLMTLCLGSGLGLQLFLRAEIPLHGMAFLNRDGTASVVLGYSGAGKSTLAASFIAAGLPVFSDDIIPVRQHKDGLYIYPAQRRLKLNPATIKELDSLLGTSAGGGAPAYPNTDKEGYYAPPEAFPSYPARLSHCYVIRGSYPLDDTQAITRTPVLSSLERTQTLHRFCYRPHLAKSWHWKELTFRQSVQLSQQAGMSLLKLPDISHFQSLQDYAAAVTTSLQR